MRFAIISDTHFGDDTCALVSKKDNKIVKGLKYDEFKNAAGQGNDYLILAGDILDFSITNYETAYRYAQFFFFDVIPIGLNMNCNIKHIFNTIFNCVFNIMGNPVCF